MFVFVGELITNQSHVCDYTPSILRNQHFTGRKQEPSPMINIFRLFKMFVAGSEIAMNLFTKTLLHEN